MKITVNYPCSEYTSYRTARVKSLFNVENSAFHKEVDLPIEGKDWKIGVVVGASGSGKSSVGRLLWPDTKPYQPKWPQNTPIIDAITPHDNFNAVTGALAAVGLGSVPTWLRSYQHLSNGEQFRADLAKIVCEAPKKVVIDEFSSVIDRQIAKVGAGAFQKAWRRTGSQAVLLTCHYDVLDWLEPDWVLDMSDGSFTGSWLRQRPPLELEIWETNWRYWPLFEPHHYLKLPHMIAANCYVGVINGELVAHAAFSTRAGLVEARACRLVIMPEWQGAGVGLRFLDAIAQQWRQGENRYHKPMPTLFHTSHPGLAMALRRSKKWTQVSASLCGGNKARSIKSISKSSSLKQKPTASAGYGGHFRAVQGFRYLGEAQSP